MVFISPCVVGSGVFLSRQSPQQLHSTTSGRRLDECKRDSLHVLCLRDDYDSFLASPSVGSAEGEVRSGCNAVEE